MNDMRGWRRGFTSVELLVVSKRRCAAFTLVELLVVIAIIGILVALLLPAIQAAREASRRSSCSNNLKQIALGVQNHAATFEQFPSAGFGYRWVGDPHYGTGRQQPGGWIYNTLPFIEEQSIHDMGMGIGSTYNDAARKAVFAQRASMTIKTLICPTRRSGGPYTNTTTTGVVAPYDAKNQDPAIQNARSDYAGNIGNGDTAVFPSGPGSIDETLVPGYEQTLALCCYKFGKQATGVFTYWSFNRLKSVTDGLSKTYCVGEKYVQIDAYENGQDGGDDQNLYSGMDRDNLRWGRGKNQGITETGEIPPLQDAFEDHDSNFGSAHPGIFLMSFCDGSVQSIGFDIDTTMHGRFANRKDGDVAELSK